MSIPSAACWLLCGRPPFDAEGVGDLIVMHLREIPPPLSSLRPGIPAEIEQLVLRCLAKNPAERYASGEELATAIGALTGSSPQLPAPSGAYAAASTPTTLSAATGASVGATQPPPSKRSRNVVLVGFCIAVAGGVFAIAFGSSRGRSDEAPAPAKATESFPLEPALRTPEPAPKTVAPMAPDRATEVAPRMKPVFERFTAWSREHAGAPCPDVADLGVQAMDPWGHALHLTCTDQPGDQIVGAVSAGPDGAPGTNDDIVSWSLGRDVTDLVRGPRWVVAEVEKPTLRPTSTKNTSKTPTNTKSSRPHLTPTNPGGAMELDENGMPISR